MGAAAAKRRRVEEGGAAAAESEDDAAGARVALLPVDTRLALSQTEARAALHGCPPSPCLVPLSLLRGHQVEVRR